MDQLFYSPRAAEEDTICGVGAEMRDYPTLIEAIRGTDLRCHIATDQVRIPHRFRLVTDRRVPVDTLSVPHDARITMGRKTLPELRDLYARSRFVVVPLVPSDSDNGVTVILEAMAMGKPVICSRTRGQVDVIQDGVTGIYVPVGDPAALRETMLSLWNEPQSALTMGVRARAYVEQHHTLERFASNVRAAAEASLEGRPAPRFVVDRRNIPRSSDGASGQTRMTAAAGAPPSIAHDTPSPLPPPSDQAKADRKTVGCGSKNRSTGYNDVCQGREMVDAAADLYGLDGER